MGNLVILHIYSTVNDLYLNLRSWLVMAKKPYPFKIHGLELRKFVFVFVVKQMNKR